MRFELLVEGLSDKLALEHILPKILGHRGGAHSWSIHKHQGIGTLPDNLWERPDPKNGTLLHNLPAYLRAYGKALGQDGAVIVLVDLDRHDLEELQHLLKGVLICCRPAPKVLFAIAIEEMEAWYLGDMRAVIKAYPKVKRTFWKRYQQDSI